MSTRTTVDANGSKWVLVKKIGHGKLEVTLMLLWLMRGN
jgi:hypothetical protein